MRGARTLDYFHPVLGRAGVAPEVAPSVEVKVGGRGRWGGGERAVGWHNVLPRADQLYSRNWFCLSPLPPSFRESMYWLVPVDSGWSFQHFLLTRSHVFVTTKSYIDS